MHTHWTLHTHKNLCKLRERKRKISKKKVEKKKNSKGKFEERE